MTLEKTRLYLSALRSVQDEQVVWRQAGPPAPIPRRSEGFSHANGSRFKPAFLVALWELKFAGLITVDDSQVQLTVEGKEWLSEWEPSRAVTS